MAFWRNFGVMYPVSNIENILDRADFTLEDLLNEDDIVQEVKVPNKRLVEFLTKKPQLDRLFDMFTLTTDESQKYSAVACEIIIADVQPIMDLIFSEEQYITRLLDALCGTAPLPMKLATEVCRVVTVLLEKKAGEVIECIKARGPAMIQCFTSNLHSFHILALVLSLVILDEHIEGTVQWLCDNKLVPSFLDIFGTTNGENIENAARTLMAIINKSPLHRSSPLLEEIQSELTIQTLFQHILAPKTTTALTGGLDVLKFIIEKQGTKQLESAPLESLSPVFAVSVAHFAKLREILEAPSTPLMTSLGSVEPFGFTKLKILEFFLSLLKCNYKSLNQPLIESGILTFACSIFAKHKWNNYLHSVIHQLIETILYGPNLELKLALIEHAHLDTKVIEAYMQNSESEAANGNRMGYMGHLFKICDVLEMECKRNAELKSKLHEHYVTIIERSWLPQMRKQQMAPLIGSRSSYHDDSSSENSSDEYSDFFSDEEDHLSTPNPVLSNDTKLDADKNFGSTHSSDEEDDDLDMDAHGELEEPPPDDM